MPVEYGRIEIRTGRGLAGIESKEEAGGYGRDDAVHDRGRRQLYRWSLWRGDLWSLTPSLGQSPIWWSSRSIGEGSADSFLSTSSSTTTAHGPVTPHRCRVREASPSREETAVLARKWPLRGLWPRVSGSPGPTSA